MTLRRLRNGTGAWWPPLLKRLGKRNQQELAEADAYLTHHLQPSEDISKAPMRPVQALTARAMAHRKELNKSGLSGNDPDPPFSCYPPGFTFHQPVLDVSPEEYKRLLALQQDRESHAMEKAAERYRREIDKAIERGDAATLPGAKRLLQRWFRPLTNAIAVEQQACLATACSKKPGSANRPGQMKYGWYIPLLHPDKLAVITMHTIVGLLLRGKPYGGSGKSTTGGASPYVKSIQVAHDLGDNMQTQVQSEPRNVLRDLEKRFGSYVTEDWGREMRLKVGDVLLTIAKENLQVDVPSDNSPAETKEVPALQSEYTRKHERKESTRHEKQYKYSSVRFHPSVPVMLDNEIAAKEVFDPKHMPMVVPPRQWTSISDGGYLNFDTLAIRGGYSRLGPSRLQLQELYEVENAAKAGKVPYFHSLLDALNVLGATPWRINKRVHDALERLWQSGGGIAKLPTRSDEPLPEQPSKEFCAYQYGQSFRVTYSVPHFRARWYKKAMHRARSRNNELHSMRCDMELKLQVARMLRNERCFFYPHNIDFRGRAYPIHPHLHHLGADPSRGMLTFATSHRLGSDGLKWLKAQIASMYGHGIDKRPQDEKVSFVDEHLDHIRSSARQPVEGQRWWMGAEEPWQCLATCIELDDALSSGDPENFSSSLPVHQDGSCNGLQHYAALGRDSAGAESVNLLPTDRPADVYANVAEQMRTDVEQDTHSAEKKEHRKLAELLLPEVDRKLVKQTVMTSVYGVTFVGAKEQIRSRLKERGAFPSQSENVKQQISQYAARKTFKALSNTFANARQVMNWLTDCARLITRKGDFVRWRTPLGLPVLQPYEKPRKRPVKTVMHTFQMHVQAGTSNLVKPSPHKQRSAFPPNFIHSLDSSHMMMTALEMHQRGLTFAGVHDSFWTHAGCVTEMNEILREKFVELHSQPLLGNLYLNFLHRYPDLASELPEPPELGDLNLDDVKRSTFFFS